MSNKAPQFQFPGFVEEFDSTKIEERKPAVSKMFKDRPDGACEGPRCSNVVPGGKVHFNVKQYFCSDSCRRKEYSNTPSVTN